METKCTMGFRVIVDLGVLSLIVEVKRSLDLEGSSPGLTVAEEKFWQDFWSWKGSTTTVALVLKSG